MMKFSCEKVLLQSAIAVTSRAVAQKSSIPALEGLLLHVDSGLTVSGYNMQTGIRTKVSVDVVSGGADIQSCNGFVQQYRFMLKFHQLTPGFCEPGRERPSP